MDKSLTLALLTGLVSFFVIFALGSFIDRNLNIEVPGWLGFILGLIGAFVLYIKKDFFFSTPIAAGITMGIFLALLWNIRDLEFIMVIVKTILSVRFIMWVGTAAAGIYKRDIVIDIWNERIISTVPQARPYILLLAVMIYITGSVFMLFPEFYVRKAMKNTGFSMIRKVPVYRKVLTQIAGVLMVLISSTLIVEVVAFIGEKIG